MEQKDRDLLFKDLCGRLPYRTICKDEYSGCVGKLNNIGYDDSKQPLVEIDSPEALVVTHLKFVKPYLRPMRSMSDDEETEFNEVVGYKGESDDGWTICENIHTRYGVWIRGCSELMNWLNNHHFDYMGLIDIGLAIEAPEGMYDFK